MNKEKLWKENGIKDGKKTEKRRKEDGKKTEKRRKEYGKNTE